MKENKNTCRSHYSYLSSKTTHSHPRQNPLSAFADILIKELEATNRKHTADTCRAAVRSIVAFTGNKNLLLEDISPGLMGSYENHLLQKGLCLNSVSFYTSRGKVLCIAILKELKF
jgi:hypothetical protein